MCIAWAQGLSSHEQLSGASFKHLGPSADHHFASSTGWASLTSQSNRDSASRIPPGMPGVYFTKNSATLYPSFKTLLLATRRSAELPLPSSKHQLGGRRLWYQSARLLAPPSPRTGKHHLTSGLLSAHRKAVGTGPTSSTSFFGFIIVSVFAVGAKIGTICKWIKRTCWMDPHGIINGPENAHPGVASER